MNLLQAILGILRDGALRHRSLPCALLYARFLVAADAKWMLCLQTSDHVSDFINHAELTQTDLWGDPQQDVIHYGDTMGKMYGEEVSSDPLYLPFAARHLTCSADHDSSLSFSTLIDNSVNYTWTFWNGKTIEAGNQS